MLTPSCVVGRSATAEILADVANEVVTVVIEEEA
jgi:hypothetical protein